MEDKNEIVWKCLEICQQFGHLRNFNFNVSIGESFNFTMNHGYSINASDNKTKKRKYVSPSTRRRNASRLADFKAKKATPSSEEICPLEPPGVGGSPPGSLPGEDYAETIHTRDDPTNLETRRVDVPLVVAVDVHPPPIPPPSHAIYVAKPSGKKLA